MVSGGKLGEHKFNMRYEACFLEHLGTAVIKIISGGEQYKFCFMKI